VLKWLEQSKELLFVHIDLQITEVESSQDPVSSRNALAASVKRRYAAADIAG
jgi:hypothetical protein